MYLLARKLKRYIRTNCWDDVEQLLSERGGLINFNFADEHWQMKATTPLFLTVELCLEGNFDPEKVHYLLRKGADPNKSSLFEGDDHLPIVLCTTVTAEKTERALIVASMLIEFGSSVHAKNLLPNTIQRMINYPRDYNATMIEFLCRNGCPQRQKHEALAKLVSQRFSWAPAIANCLLNEGAYIYCMGLTNTTSPYFLAQRYNTLTAELVQHVDRAINNCKVYVNFEDAVHHEEDIDVHPAQLKKFVNNFDVLVTRIQKNERNAYLALRHPQSKAKELPDDIFRNVMNFVTSEKAKRRVRRWLSN